MAPNINLKVAAYHANVKGVDIASQIGVPPQTVSRWLNGRSLVPSKHLADVARLLKVRVEDLLPPLPNPWGDAQ